MDWIRLINISNPFSNNQCLLLVSCHFFLFLVCDICIYMIFIVFINIIYIYISNQPSHLPSNIPPPYSSAHLGPLGRLSRFRWSFPSVKWPWETTKISSHSARFLLLQRGVDGCRGWEERRVFRVREMCWLRFFFDKAENWDDIELIGFIGFLKKRNPQNNSLFVLQ